MAPYAGTKLVTFHDSWPNFAKRFKLTVAGHVEPKPGIPPSPSHTLEIINLIQEKKIPVDPRRALLRPEDAGLDRREDRRGRADLLSRRSAACRRSRTTSRLFDYDIDALRRPAMKREEMTVFEILLPGLRREPHPDRASTPTSASTSSSAASSSWTSRWRRSRRSARRSAYLAGYDLHSTTAYLFSLGFTFLGAAIFAMSRVAPQDAHPAGGDHRHRLRRLGGRRDPRHVEGDAGDRAPEGDAGRQHPFGLLDGARARRPSSTRSSASSTTSSASSFLLISMNEAEAERRGWNIRFWDFLFYVSFGFVVTSSVAIAGVLLVFCFLIVPVRHRDALRRAAGAAPRDRLDDGGHRLGRRRRAVVPPGPADGGHDRRDVRRRRCSILAGYRRAFRQGRRALRVREHRDRCGGSSDWTPRRERVRRRPRPRHRHLGPRTRARQPDADPPSVLTTHNPQSKASHWHAVLRIVEEDPCWACHRGPHSAFPFRSASTVPPVLSRRRSGAPFLRAPRAFVARFTRLSRGPPALLVDLAAISTVALSDRGGGRRLARRFLETSRRDPHATDRFA